MTHDDIDWVIYAPMSVFPFAGPRHGRAAVLAAMAEIAVSFSLESYNPQVTIIEGARAALMSGVGYRQRATGRMLRLRIAGFMRLQDGRLIEYREFIDKLRRGRTGAGARTAALTATLPRSVPDVRCTA